MKTFNNSKETKPFKIGTKIQWNWMGRVVVGKIEKIYSKPVTKTFRGTVFKRNATKERPAYLVISTAMNKVLKSHTELSKYKPV